MITKRELQQLESELQSVLREIRENVSEEHEIDCPEFADAGFLYRFFAENWGTIRNLRNGNHVAPIKRKERILSTYDYLRNMADRIESGQKMRKSEQLPIKTYLIQLEQ